MQKFVIQKISAGEAAGHQILDSYREQLEELFLIRNPRFRFEKDHSAETKAFVDEHHGGKDLKECGSWFYLPWSNVAVHYLPEDLWLELRTARNKNLITKDEQELLYNSCVGFAGLSVGSHGALTLAMMGGAKQIKLADPDTISGSNLNRIRYGATSIGVNKALVATRIIAEINPYAEIYLYEEGLTPENIEGFVSGSDGSPAIKILAEGVDNLPMKIMLRESCKPKGIPVLMATDNGDSVIVDVERYDLDKSMQIFNGALGDFGLEQFKQFPPQELPRLATKVAGPDYIEPRMLGSLLEVGKTLYSWPQLGSAATFSGVVTAYLIRALLTGRPITSGKYDVNLTKIFDPGQAASDEAERDGFLKQMKLRE